MDGIDAIDTISRFDTSTRNWMGSKHYREFRHKCNCCKSGHFDECFPHLHTVPILDFFDSQHYRKSWLLNNNFSVPYIHQDSQQTERNNQENKLAELLRLKIVVEHVTGNLSMRKQTMRIMQRIRDWSISKCCNSTSAQTQNHYI